jgi:hypothetical protein
LQSKRREKMLSERLKVNLSRKRNSRREEEREKSKKKN